MNVIKLRNESKACLDKIFFNSAGSSLMPISVLEKMSEYLFEESQIGGYKLTEKRNDDIIEFYIQVGKLLNCPKENIAFMASATEAYYKALSSIKFKKGDCILTTQDDYISNQMAFFQLKSQFGIDFIRIKNRENGDLDFEDLEKLILQCNPKLIAITHIPTNSGKIQDAEKVGELCEKYNLLYLLDACQSVGQINVDVQKIKCDFLSATGRKFLRGPRGTGFLYLSDKVKNGNFDPLFVDMKGADWTNPNEYKAHQSAKRFELWELSYANLVGLSEAVRYANEIGIDEIEKYNQMLSREMRLALAKIPNLKIKDEGSKLSNIISLHIENTSLEKISHYLNSNNIYYSVSHRQHSLLDMNRKNLDWTIRFSPHYFNTIEEINLVEKILLKF